jgi:hypothetical protein
VNSGFWRAPRGAECDHEQGGGRHEPFHEMLDRLSRTYVAYRHRRMSHPVDQTVPPGLRVASDPIASLRRLAGPGGV